MRGGRPFSSRHAATAATAAALLCCLPLARGFVHAPTTAAPGSKGGRRAFAGGRGTRMMVRIEDVLKNPKWPGAWIH